MDEALERLARKAVWGKPPTEAVADTTHFLAHALSIGDWEDWRILEREFSAAQIRECLERPPIGVFDEGTWNLWRKRLGLPEARLPSTRPFEKSPAESVDIGDLAAPEALQDKVSKGSPFIVSVHGVPVAEVNPLPSKTRKTSRRRS